MAEFNWPDFAAKLSVWLLPALLAITLHEAAHGYVARMLGDDTAYRLGRLTLNPLRHIDPIGTILLPGFLLLAGTGFIFGWAKPVPVIFGRLRRPKRDMVWVAAAGPGTNIALAIVSALAIHLAVLLPGDAQAWTKQNLANSMLINVFLAVFNMLPLPPLDGGRVAVGLLPRGPSMALASLERYGFMIVILVFLILPRLPLQLGGVRLDPLRWLIAGPANWILDLIETATGLR